jgi:hypothetical protein
MRRSYFVFVALSRPPFRVLLSEAKNLRHFELLRFAQDDKIGFCNRDDFERDRDVPMEIPKTFSK